MKVSSLQSPKEEKADKKSEIIKIELQKYRMLKAKTAAVKEADVSPSNNESLADSKNASMLNRNRISLAELLSPQTYQNLMLVKDDPFKRPKTPERTPNKKPTVDKENYVIPTLSSISASVNNSKIKSQEVKSPEHRNAHDSNLRSTQSSAFKENDDRNSHSSHEERAYLLKQDRKSTPLLPKSQNRPQSSINTGQRNRQSSKTPERSLSKQSSLKKQTPQEIKSPVHDPSVDDYEEMRSPSVRKSNLPKASVVESTFEALADLKRTLSKKKLAIADNNESTEEVETSKSKRETKRAGTPDNHSKRESIGNRDRPSSSLMNHSSSKQNLQSNNPNPNISVSKDSKETQETGDKALQEEVEKWKKFGKMMADSYEELNNKFTSFMKESEKDKKVIHALKEQITKLKSLIKLQNDTSTSQGTLKKSSSQHINISNRINEEPNEDEDDELEFIKNENRSLRKTVEELQKVSEESEYYKKLAEAKFRECSALAEEIICLRTDLDRSHTNYLRIQRQHGSGSKLASAVSEKQQQKTHINVKSFSEMTLEPERHAPPSRHREYIRDEDESSRVEHEDEPPSPQKFTIRPAKDERNKNY